VSHALKRSYKTISTLKDENDNLRTNIKTTQKRLCRIQTRTANPQTPRSKTNLILKKSGYCQTQFVCRAQFVIIAFLASTCHWFYCIWIFIHISKIGIIVLVCLVRSAKRLCRIQTRTANPQTPRSKTNLILKKSGIDPKNLLDIRKRLICNECLTEEVQIAVDDNPTRKKAVHKVVIILPFPTLTVSVFPGKIREESSLIRKSTLSCLNLSAFCFKSGVFFILKS
jgi:hypothetical protein